MSTPYGQAADALQAGLSKPEAAPRKSSMPTARATPAMQVVGRKFVDPQSMEDESYMAGAQKRINKRLSQGAERISGEYRSRRYNDRRFGGRRSGR